jgi:hypothetical protein
MDAEYVAYAETANEAVWVRNVINGLHVPGVYIDAVRLCVDCNSALKLTRNPEFHNKSKYIDGKRHFVRENVEEGLINIQCVNTKDNLAYVFTKALPRSTDEDLVNRPSEPSVRGRYFLGFFIFGQERKEDRPGFWDSLGCLSPFRSLA